MQVLQEMHLKGNPSAVAHEKDNGTTEVEASRHSTSTPNHMLYKRKHGGETGSVCKGGNVVKTLTIGNTKVKICDDYCRDKTPAEVQATLSRIACKAQEHLSAYAAIQINK